jgi:hypothetical protein
MAQSLSGRYYSETGHTLDAEFVEYFDNHGGLGILGFPITDAFVDYWTGLVIQYTQNGRMELFPDPTSDDMQVRLKLRATVSVSCSWTSTMSMVDQSYLDTLYQNSPLKMIAWFNTSRDSVWIGIRKICQGSKSWWRLSGGSTLR